MKCQIAFLCGSLLVSSMLCFGSTVFASACTPDVEAKTREEQRVLLEHYAEALGEAMGEEHFERIGGCVSMLSSIFRFRLFEGVALPGKSSALAEAAQKVASDVVDDMCQEGLAQIKQATQGLKNTVWARWQSEGEKASWKAVFSSILAGNRSVANACKRRLNDLLR